MGKPRNPRPGQYRHTPGSYLPAGPDGRAVAVRTRRRFPYLGLVFIGAAMLGPLLCGGVSLLFQMTALRALVPTRYTNLPLPPSPSVENILFGAGLHELVLASAVCGWWLWRSLWRLRLAPELQKAGVAGVIRPLLAQGLLVGPLCVLAAGLPIAAMGLFLRTGPAEIPWAVKPLFGLVALFPVAISALFTGTVPVVLVLLGMVAGAAAAVGVALGWQRFPEEVDMR